MSGKGLPKKDLGLIAMAYGYVYVARVAMGYNDQQTLKAFLEAESYDGPSLVIAYSHCIEHGFDMIHGLEQQKLAVQSARGRSIAIPRLTHEGKNPLIIESKEPSIPLSQYAYNEFVIRCSRRSMKFHAEELMREAQQDAKARWTLYEQMAAIHYDADGNGEQKK